ncbi:MAG TPA: riboflavin synthase [Gammaproteobacteria bacterium]|nr:riboflavin synthase [Gammaproteobacteria bacterium]
MFTGIIEAVGSIVAIEAGTLDTRLQIGAGTLYLSALKIGESLSINGVCLTIVGLADEGFCVDVSRETLRCTTLGDLIPGAALNLERALTLASRLGGHLVSGHVDGVGTLVNRAPEGQSIRYTLEAPDHLAKYISQKGAICIDGVSLTVNAVRGAEFEVQLIPHTLQKTIAASYRPGTHVNIEVDLIARYIHRLLETSNRVQAPTVIP